MKQTRFFHVFSLVSCFLLVATTGFAQPGRLGGNRGENFPDFSCMFSPTRSVQVDLVKQMTAMPEFAEFVDALTARIDEAARNQPDFSPLTTKYFLDKVREAKGKTDISSKDVFELFYSQVELIQIEAFVKKAYDESVATGIIALEINVDHSLYNNARLTVVTKFHPEELSGILDFIPPEIKFDIIKGEENDFLVSFEVSEDNEKLFIGGQKLEGRDAYTTVLSLNRDLVEQKLRMMQNERFREFLLGDNAPANSLRLGKGVFDFIKASILEGTHFDDLDPGEKNTVNFVEQINGFSVTTRDIDGKTNIQTRLALTDEETVGGLMDIINGGKALLRFMAAAESNEDTKMLFNFVRNIEIVCEGTTLTAMINLSSDEFLHMVKGGLIKGAEESIVGIVIDENGISFRTGSN